MARAGLKKVIKTVKGQSGKTFKRSYQVRSTMAGYKPDPRFNDAWKKTKKGGLTGGPTKIGRKGFDDAMRIAKRKKKWGIFSSQPSQGSEAAASGLGGSASQLAQSIFGNHYLQSAALGTGAGLLAAHTAHDSRNSRPAVRAMGTASSFAASAAANGMAAGLAISRGKSRLGTAAVSIGATLAGHALGSRIWHS
jgi:hypothetical protein